MASGVFRLIESFLTDEAFRYRLDASFVNTPYIVDLIGNS